MILALGALGWTLVILIPIALVILALMVGAGFSTPDDHEIGTPDWPAPPDWVNGGDDAN